MKLIIAVALAGLVILIVNTLFAYLWDRNLSVKIGFDRDMLYEGEENILREVITNAKYLPLPILQVKFSITRTFIFEREENTSVTDLYYRNEFYTVMPFQKITRAYPFRCTHRGLFRMNKMDLICRSLFMGDKMIEPIEHEASVCVLPSKIVPREVPTNVTNLLGEIEKNMHINEDPFTFAGIRDYQPYDNMHSINWKATARMGNLLVNTYNTTFSKKVVLLLNMETNSMLNVPELQEGAIRIAAHLASFYIMHQIPVAMYTNGVDEVDKISPEIEAGADLSHIRTIEIALARLDTSTRPIAFTKLMEQKVVTSNEPVEYLIISNSRRKDILDAYRMHKTTGHSMHYIIPEFKSMGLEDEFFGGDYTPWIITNEDETFSNNYGHH